MSRLTTPVIRRRSADISSTLQRAALPEVLKTIYAGRGISDPADLTITLDQLLPPATLKGISEAA